MAYSQQTERESTFSSKVLKWGEKNRRQFPWRQTRDPYYVFVAECLVQRTKAEQAQPVYQRFLERFPDIESLSRASERQIRPVVRTLGLDYRVRRIRTMAREIVKAFGGRFRVLVTRVRKYLPQIDKDLALVKELLQVYERSKREKKTTSMKAVEVAKAHGFKRP